MPIYEYQCDRCGIFELTQRITEKPLRRCPTCKGKVTKLISATSFHLKGSGWYVTDYAGKDGKKGKEEGGKTDGKTDATPAKESAKEPASKDTSSSSSKTEASAA